MVGIIYKHILATIGYYYDQQLLALHDLLLSLLREKSYTFKVPILHFQQSICVSFLEHALYSCSHNHKSEIHSQSYSGKQLQCHCNTLLVLRNRFRCLLCLYACTECLFVSMYEFDKARRNRICFLLTMACSL